MGIKDFFRNSSNNIYKENMELLEDYDLISPLGSPNKLFLKFLNSKNLKINEDELTVEMINEFEDSMDSINLKLVKIQKEKEIIFNQKKVWVNIDVGGELIGSDLFLNHDNIMIEFTGQKILYADIVDIEIDHGSWSKDKFIIITENEDFIFEINENKTTALKEILEDNINHQNYDEINALMDLYSLFDEGLISEEELEVRKAIIYSDDTYCTNCGVKLDSDSEFCSNCGFKVMD